MVVRDMIPLTPEFGGFKPPEPESYKSNLNLDEIRHEMRELIDRNVYAKVDPIEHKVPTPAGGKGMYYMKPQPPSGRSSASRPSTSASNEVKSINMKSLKPYRIYRPKSSATSTVPSTIVHSSNKGELPGMGPGGVPLASIKEASTKTPKMPKFRKKKKKDGDSEVDGSQTERPGSSLSSCSGLSCLTGVSNVSHTTSALLSARYFKDRPETMISDITEKTDSTNSYFDKNYRHVAVELAAQKKKNKELEQRMQMLIEAYGLPTPTPDPKTKPDKAEALNHYWKDWILDPSRELPDHPKRPKSQDFYSHNPNYLFKHPRSNITGGSILSPVQSKGHVMIDQQVLHMQRMRPPSHSGISGLVPNVRNGASRAQRFLVDRRAKARPGPGFSYGVDYQGRRVYQFEDQRQVNRDAGLVKPGEGFQLKTVGERPDAM